MYSIFGFLLVLHLGGLILPGLDFAVVFGYSVMSGKKSGIACAVGIAIGVMINALISFLIGQSLRDNFPILYSAFILIGLIYLIYSGVLLIGNYWKPSAQGEFLQGKPVNNTKRPFVTGLLTNILNVKVIIFFNSTLPLVNHLNGLFKITIWISMGILTAAWFSLVACLFGHTNIRNIFLKHIAIVGVVVGSVLILLSLAIFYGEILC